MFYYLDFENNSIENIRSFKENLCKIVKRTVSSMLCKLSSLSEINITINLPDKHKLLVDFINNNGLSFVISLMDKDNKRYLLSKDEENPELISEYLSKIIEINDKSFEDITETIMSAIVVSYKTIINKNLE